MLISEQAFRALLLEWYAQSHRPLPWKEEKDPYVIWLSEIILQQTRVAQGLPYFKRFLERFPKVEDLAAAPEEEVMKLWEGLGYYSRARYLHHSAKVIAKEFGGVFPDSYDEIKALKGVGPYTAAAIASFAFDLPHAVVDGNVFRVLARLFGIDLPIDSSAGKKRITALASRMLDRDRPGVYNQAIMDFGATQCTPRQPACPQCPFQKNCVAFQAGQVGRLPVKARKIQKKDRFFHYLVLYHRGAVFLRKRTEGDIWRNLFEFPLIELPRPAADVNDLKKTSGWENWIGETGFEIRQISRPFRQTLTHQKITATFWKVWLSSPPLQRETALIRADPENLRKFAFPKIIDCYLRDKSLYLNLL
jgi:A/G-specific adenine glycosylase